MPRDAARTTAPIATATIVGMMRDAGATVIVLNTPHDECQRRLKQRYIDETTV